MYLQNPANRLFIGFAACNKILFQPPPAKAVGNSK